MALTGKRDLFAREYLKDLNATKAAERAGYAPGSCNQEGSRLLADDEVQAHIAALAAERNTELKIEARDILLELLRIASVDPSPMLEDNGCVKSVHDIPIDVRRTIASIDVEETFEWRDGDVEDGDIVGERGKRDRVRVWTGQIRKIKFWNKNDALNSLGRHLALFKDVIEHRFDGGLVASDIELAAKVAALLEDARRRKADDLV